MKGKPQSICQHDAPHEPVSIPNWKLATLELETLPHWQHSQSPPLRATSLIRICDVAGRQGKRYRFGGRDFVWGGFEGCRGKGAHFRAGLGVGSFIPAFARCCFCIAASLLVFTSPMTSPLALLCHCYCADGGLLFPATGYLRDEPVRPFNGRFRLSRLLRRASDRLSRLR